MSMTLPAHTQYEANHGAEVASPAAKVEEGQAGVKIQCLHHFRVNTRSREMDVSMSPCQVLMGASIHVNQLVHYSHILQTIMRCKSIMTTKKTIGTFIPHNYFPNISFGS